MHAEGKYKLPGLSHSIVGAYKEFGAARDPKFWYRIAVGQSSICYGISCDLLVKIVTDRREESLATGFKKKTGKNFRAI